MSLLYTNDVLLVNGSTAAESFTWVPSVNGTFPANSFVTGRHPNGELLYSCRALENGPSQDPNFPDNDPNGEFIPGYIGAGTQGCHYEFYGEKISQNYEVLVWSGLLEPSDSTDYSHTAPGCDVAENGKQLEIACQSQ